MMVWVGYRGGMTLWNSLGQEPEKGLGIVWYDTSHRVSYYDESLFVTLFSTHSLTVGKGPFKQKYHRTTRV